MKIQIYMPTVLEDKQKLNRTAAAIQIMCMESFLKELSCTTKAKISLLSKATELTRKK